jgi:hypothetical protein
VCQRSDVRKSTNECRNGQEGISTAAGEAALGLEGADSALALAYDAVKMRQSLQILSAQASLGKVRLWQSGVRLRTKVSRGRQAFRSCLRRLAPVCILTVQ